MRDFSWQYFARTGDVDAYLLYKAAQKQSGEEDEQRSDHEITEQKTPERG